MPPLSQETVSATPDTPYAFRVYNAANRSHPTASRFELRAAPIGILGRIQPAFSMEDKK
jgi:hypothetical protein